MDNDETNNNEELDYLVGYNGEAFLTLPQKPERISGKVCKDNDCCLIDIDFINIEYKDESNKVNKLNVNKLNVTECK